MRTTSPEPVPDDADLCAVWAGWAPVASAVLDADLVCAWANPRFADLAGTTPDGARGRRLESLLRVGARGLDRLRAVAEHATETRLTVVVPPLPLASADRLLAERWRVHAFPLDHDGRSLVGLVAVDVTDDADLDLHEDGSVATAPPTAGVVRLH